jgi:outer membrane protein assembly factor BamB
MLTEAGNEKEHKGYDREEFERLLRVHREKKRRRRLIVLAAVLVVAAAAGCGVYVHSRWDTWMEARAIRQSEREAALLQAELETEQQITETEEPETEAVLEFSPHCTDSTDPNRLIEWTEIEVNGEYYDPSDYQSDSVISFERGSQYTEAEGVVTFRGNNFRDTPAYGLAEMTDNTLSGVWTKQTGGLSYGDATWTGSGWTGQPLLMKWPKETKEQMNMYDWAKEDDDLVEVIYACMDGYVYFLDLTTGEATRDALYLGYTFKGAGALDPRGYPILYVGAGYDSNEGTARSFIISLIDCSVLYTFGNNDSFSLRGSLSYFDSSALVDAETDTLIYPGENGILYLIHLNTQYDETAGTLSIDPDRVVKWRYNGVRTSTASYWLGMEDSAAIYDGYLFITDNGGNLMCLDLNTLQLVWVQDTLDDSNSTPVLSVEDGHLYLYVSTSFHLGWRSSSTATVPIWKIDAETGEIMWQTEYECYTQDGVSGGVQSTIAVGKQNLSDYIYVTVAMTGTSYGGVLACLDKTTGKAVWEHSAYYAWSSPVCVYNSDGTGKVLYCSCAGQMYLLDGLTGEVNDSLALSDGAIEASPAVYEDYVVVGTRACQIWGIHLN